MTKLFISYRRQDSAARAGRLFDALASRYGSDQVFLDIANIPAGINWVQHITAAIEMSDAVLVVVGPEWLGALDPSTGQRRLDNPEDFLRIQLATALRLQKFVLPVLVGGAAMPRAAQLPSDITGLANLHALAISDSSWDSDIDSLIKVLDRRLARKRRRWLWWKR